MKVSSVVWFILFSLVFIRWWNW